MDISTVDSVWFDGVEKGNDEWHQLRYDLNFILIEQKKKSISN